MKEIRRSAIVEHSAAEMYRLVDDVESYPQFLPWCQAVRIETIGGKRHATLTVGLRGIRQSFTTVNENHPDQAIDLRLVEGPFKRFQADWRFVALSAGACEIVYSMRYEFASRVIGKLLEPLFDQIADTMVDAFTRRADELHGRHPG
jgi:ribosome-associated toxin RatA of RatAB toxin-antitoxin module